MKIRSVDSGKGLVLIAISVILSSCALWLSSQASAGTYYVSPNGSGNGSSTSSPLKAQLALNAARDGDVVVFLDGIYPPLTMLTHDIGSGIITLRAANP